MSDKPENIVRHFILEEKHLVEKYNDRNELPQKIRIEASTICQLDCVMCHMKRRTEEVKNGCGFGFLKLENLKKFIEENPNIKRVELSNNGEVFLNPEIIQILEYLHKKNIDIQMQNGVNLNFFNEQMAEAVVKNQVKNIIISIDGASQETYAEYRQKGNFNKVIDNIKRINFYKKKFNSKFPNLVYKFILFGHNEHEINKAKEIAEELNMEIVFSKNGYPEYSPIKNKDKVLAETGLNDVNVSPSHLLDEYNNKISNWFFCTMLWEDPQINYDGKILGCCYLFQDDLGGNVFKDGYLEAMNHPKLLYTKAMLTNNAEPAEDIPCSHCWVYEDLKKNNNFIKSPHNKS